MLTERPPSVQTLSISSVTVSLADDIGTVYLALPFPVRYLGTHFETVFDARDLKAYLRRKWLGRSDISGRGFAVGSGERPSADAKNALSG